MAHAQQEFTLVGYLEDLEKKPMKFVEPIPAARICSACSNVPRLTYYLLCGHTLCEPCYKICATTSECACPLDGDVCATGEVTSKDYPAENLLRRKVHCWNEANGCPVTLPASQIAQHVRQECEYHVTRCPKCLAAVLCRDVCAHLKSRCTALKTHDTLEAQQFADGNENTQLAFEREVKQSVVELDAKLAQVYLESSSQSEKLVELSHKVNQLNETLTKQFGPALDRNAAEIKALYAEKSESLRTAITSALTLVPNDTKTHQRVITGYAALKEKAFKDDWSWSMSNQVYLRRYLMSWGLCFEKEGDSVHLQLCVQLHEGKEDDFLDWPATNDFKLSIIHPETRQERLLRGSPSEAPNKHFSRPIKTSNPPIRFRNTGVESCSVERDGYVKEDQLLVRFEVLP
ncbi:hypothetical protein HPB48_026709 [Haemaphysalis longicornis]|uniref:RING-type domain-containing protein n=1 Tax=Haemaphysalis longicornis TaxID=44386 RepID=A0A9J6HC65_HAELO|nr:hypothetical protein HPB48_026709 [Haemaphysalis longicornis]